MNFMPCTCFKKQMPCPVHGEPGLSNPETVKWNTIVIHIHRRWTTTEDWFGEIVKNAICIYTSPDFKTEKEMINDLKLHL
jgi:hypothetical protein